MAIVKYDLRVAHLVSFGTDYKFDPTPAFSGTIQFDTSASSPEAHVTFGGFTLDFRLFPDDTQIEYKLTQPGNPMNGSLRGLGLGIVLISAVGGGASTLRQVDVEVNVSPTEKLRITMNKI